jgi:hypothetical protein
LAQGRGARSRRIHSLASQDGSLGIFCLHGSCIGIPLAAQAIVCFAIFGCVAAGWVVGFGMGYRRGVNDAITSVAAIGAPVPY